MSAWSIRNVDDRMNNHQMRNPRTTDLLRDAMDLYEVAEVLTRQRLQREHPQWNSEQLDDAVTQWFLHRHGAPDGDFSGGKVVPWPRKKMI
jgi:hypothetical protein